MTMITENDIKALRRHETRSGKVTNWLVVVAPVFLVVMAVLNLYAASRIGSYADVELLQLFQTWLRGIDISTQYSGLFLKAIERVETALIQLGLALMLSILAVAYHQRRRMDARILETLKRSGSIKI